MPSHLPSAPLLWPFSPSPKPLSHIPLTTPRVDGTGLNRMPEEGFKQQQSTTSNDTSIPPTFTATSPKIHPTTTKSTAHTFPMQQQVNNKSQGGAHRSSRTPPLKNVGSTTVWPAEGRVAKGAATFLSSHLRRAWPNHTTFTFHTSHNACGKIGGSMYQPPAPSNHTIRPTHSQSAVHVNSHHHTNHSARHQHCTPIFILTHLHTSASRPHAGLSSFPHGPDVEYV